MDSRQLVVNVRGSRPVVQYPSLTATSFLSRLHSTWCSSASKHSRIRCGFGSGSPDVLILTLRTPLTLARS